MSKDYFKKRKTAPVEKLHLPEGKVRVVCIETKFMHHRMNWDGSERQPKDGEYVDNMPQIGCLLKDVETGIPMVIRLNGLGNDRANDPHIDTEKVKSGELTPVGKYICTTNEDGQFERVANAERTAACNRIINQFLNAAGVPVNEGISVVDAVESVPARETVFECECYNDPFAKVIDGKEVMVDNWKTRNYKPVSQETPVTDLVEKESNDLDG